MPLSLERPQMRARCFNSGRRQSGATRSRPGSRRRQITPGRLRVVLHILSNLRREIYTMRPGERRLAAKTDRADFGSDGAPVSARKQSELSHDCDLTSPMRSDPGPRKSRAGCAPSALLLCAIARDIRVTSVPRSPPDRGGNP